MSAPGAGARRIASAACLAIALVSCAGRPTPRRPGPTPPPPPPSPGSELHWEAPTPGGLPLDVIKDPARPYLYVAQKEGGLLVLGPLGAGRPTDAARLPVSTFEGLHVTALAQSGQLLYLGLGDFFSARGSRTGLAIVDVRDPAHPALRARWLSSATMTGSTAVLVDGATVYLAAKRDGIMVFDASAPDTLRHLTTFQPDPDFPKPNPGATEHPNARGLALVGDRLFVANDAGGLRVLDVADRAAPREVAKYLNAGVRNKPQAYNSVVVSNGVAYLGLDYCGMEVLDVADPTRIRQLGWWNPWGCETPQNTWFNSRGHTNQVVLDAPRRRAYLSAGGSELVVLDVSAPANPRLVHQYEHPSQTQAVWGLAVTPNETFLSYIVAVVPYRGTWAGVKAVATFR
ncbi:MAG: LVIVD repeat-containing protein [Gemmatimonadales bacterium]